MGLWFHMIPRFNKIITGFNWTVHHSIPSSNWLPIALVGKISENMVTVGCDPNREPLRSPKLDRDKY